MADKGREEENEGGEGANVVSNATSLQTLKDSADKQTSSMRIKVTTAKGSDSLESVAEMAAMAANGRPDSLCLQTREDLVAGQEEQVDDHHLAVTRRSSIGTVRQSYLMAQRRSSGSSVFFTGWSTVQNEATNQSIDSSSTNPTSNSGVQRSQSQSTADSQLSSHLRISVRASGRRRVPKRLCEVSANDPNSNMAGYMWRRLSKRHWKRYWFVLKDKVLYSYRESEDVMALQTLPLLGYRLERLDSSLDGHPAELCLAISHANQPKIFLRIEQANFFEK